MARQKTLLGLVVFLCLAMPCAAPAGTNLVTNGGFETGDFTGWTLAGDTGYTLVTDRDAGTKAPASYTPHGGEYYAMLGPIRASGTMSQTLATVAGASYTFSWWMGSDGDVANEFAASWNGSQVFDRKDIETQGYILYSFTVQATGSSTLIQFTYRDVPGYLSVDDVGVTQSVGAQTIPEPSSLILTGIGCLAIVAYPLRYGRRKRVR
jgi:hypothetical protein